VFLQRRIGTIFSSLFCCLITLSSNADTKIDINQQLEILHAQIPINDPSVPDKIVHFEDYFSQHSDAYHESIFLNISAYVNLLQQNLESAYQKLLQARSKAEISSNKTQIAESFRIEGAVLDTIGEHGEALASLNEAFSLYSELQSPKVLGVYSSISNVYVSLNDYQSMLQNSYSMLKTAQQFNDKKFEGLAYFRIAYAQIKLNRLQDAVVNSALAEKILTKINYSFIGAVYLLIAELNAAQKDFDLALKRISQSIEADRNVQFLYNEVPRLLLLTDIYLAQGEAQKAILELKKRVNDQALKKDKYQFMQILEKLITLAKLTDDPTSQLQYLEEYNQLYKQSFNQQQAQMLSLNQVKLNVLEKEKAIRLLQKENELQTQQNIIQEQQNQYQLYLTLTILAALVMVFGLLLRTRKQREQLNRYSEELIEATQAKSDFLARMSHEIRTPINAISGLTKLMQRTINDKEDATNLRQIDEASQSLMGVINDILDFSKIEAGKLDIEFTNFQLDKVISQSIRLQSIKAHQKNIELIQHIARDVPLHLIGDGFRIKQILINLISNAVKFTDEGLVSVTVKAKQSEQSDQSDQSDQSLILEFAINDTGIGLTQKQTESLFRSFSQVDETISRKFGGTGLGLAICKQLVELMHGKIWVESKPEEGSTFYFTVPVLENKTQQIRSPSKQLSTLKVLVADDVNLSRQVISEALIQANIKPSLASGGQEALAKLRQAAAENTPYDVLILDWKMPDIDGLQVAAIINQEFAVNRPKTIMLSAFDFSVVRQQAEELNIKHFIEKPFSASDLIDKLQEAVFNAKGSVQPDFAEMNNVPNLANKRILVAEDNKLNQKVTLGFLKYTHAETVIAENGLEVIETFKTQGHFDCILMDVQMPEMDGLTATQVLRNDLHCSIPIIAMTANAMKRDLEKSAESGMTAHINKPIDPEYFYQVLTEVLLKNQASSLSEKENRQDEKNQILDPDSIEDLLYMDQKKAIEKLYVDQEYFNSLLEDFVEKESSIAELDGLIENHSYDAVYKIVHDILPTLTYLGAFELAKFATNIESQLYSKTQLDDPHFHQQLQVLNLALRELVKRVKKQIS
jgi:signal transduction histidine kinase/DNA-binding response OmpR family regulator